MPRLATAQRCVDRRSRRSSLFPSPRIRPATNRACSARREPVASATPVTAITGCKRLRFLCRFGAKPALPITWRTPSVYHAASSPPFVDVAYVRDGSPGGRIWAQCSQGWTHPQRHQNHRSLCLSGNFRPSSPRMACPGPAASSGRSGARSPWRAVPRCQIWAPLGLPCRGAPRSLELR